MLSVGIELKRTGGTSRKDWKTNSNGFLRCWARGAPTLDLVVSEMTQMDGPGVSLCAAPLESSGPGFQGVAEVG